MRVLCAQKFRSYKMKFSQYMWKIHDTRLNTIEKIKLVKKWFTLMTFFPIENFLSKRQKRPNLRENNVKFYELEFLIMSTIRIFENKSTKNGKWNQKERGNLLMLLLIRLRVFDWMNSFPYVVRMPTELPFRAHLRFTRRNTQTKQSSQHTNVYWISP